MTVSQTDFSAALLDSARDAPPGLTDGLGQPAGARFSVYRNNVAVSLTEALELGFPAIRKLIGDQNFKAVTGVFLRRHPPDTPLISQYGAAFPAFLEEFSPLAHLPYLADVARLEQALRVSYHAADATPADPAILQDLAPEALLAARFTLAPAVHVIRSEYPVHGIWAYNMEDGAPKPAAIAQSVLVTRPEFDPEATAIDAPTARFITALQTGATLGQAFDAALEEAPDFDASPALGLLLDQSAITAIITTGDAP